MSQTQRPGSPGYNEGLYNWPVRECYGKPVSAGEKSAAETRLSIVDITPLWFTEEA